MIMENILFKYIISILHCDWRKRNPRTFQLIIIYVLYLYLVAENAIILCHSNIKICEATWLENL